MLELYSSSYKIVCSQIRLPFFVNIEALLLRGRKCKYQTIFHRSGGKLSTSLTDNEVNNCFNIYYTSCMNKGPKNQMLWSFKISLAAKCIIMLTRSHGKSNHQINLNYVNKRTTSNVRRSSLVIKLQRFSIGHSVVNEKKSSWGIVFFFSLLSFSGVNSIKLITSELVRARGKYYSLVWSILIDFIGRPDSKNTKHQIRWAWQTFQLIQISACKFKCANS